MSSVELSIRKGVDIQDLVLNLNGASCNPTTLKVYVEDDVSKHSIQFLVQFGKIPAWSQLTSINLTQLAIQLPSDGDILLSLSHLKALVICHLHVQYLEDDVEGPGTFTLEPPHGFHSLQELQIGWAQDELSYRSVYAILQSIQSTQLHTITLNLPPSPGSPELPSKWVGNIFTAVSTHTIQKLNIKSSYFALEQRSTLEFPYPFLRPAAIEDLFGNTALRALSFYNIETDWNHSLAFKIAKAWPYLQDIEFILWGLSMPKKGLRREQNNFMDIRDLVHFAKYSPALKRISIPFNTTFQYEKDIAARYKLNRSEAEVQSIFIGDQSCWSINNLATAAFLSHLFGKGIYTTPRPGFSRYQGLKVYRNAVSNRATSLDYNLWMCKGFDDPFYSEPLTLSWSALAVGSHGNGHILHSPRSEDRGDEEEGSSAGDGLDLPSIPDQSGVWAAGSEDEDVEFSEEAEDRSEDSSLDMPISEEIEYSDVLYQQDVSE